MNMHTNVRALAVASGVAACAGLFAITLSTTTLDAQAQAQAPGAGQPPARGQAPGPGRGGQGRGGRGGPTPLNPASPEFAMQDALRVPNLEGIWDGGGRARPVNSETWPWTKDNFPVLNERGLAYQKAFDEALAPKYDCVPSSSPAIQYDPYSMQVLQWPDRVIFRYEKDDQTRTVWLDGRKVKDNEYS
jgi:hypothetical protein